MIKICNNYRKIHNQDKLSMDFFTFKRFLSIETLIVFYYIGALILPVIIWLYAKPLIKKFNLISGLYFKEKECLWELLDKRQKIKLIGFSIPIFIFAQLLWRILFEFLIAFMRMREALLQTAI